MFRRDYIVRMIEDMTAMVAKVLTLKQDKNYRSPVGSG
ncbi:DUF6483 family protein [Paenibacillus rhizoplanae]